MKRIVLALFLLNNPLLPMEQHTPPSQAEPHVVVNVQSSPNADEETEVTCIIKSHCFKNHKDKFIFGTSGTILGFLVMLIVHLQYKC